MKVRLQNAGTSVELTSHDFVAQGGEGSVYAKQGVAYKVYTDPSRMVPTEKLEQLAELRHPAIIQPEDLLLPARGRDPVGYTMRFVTDTWPLVRLFPTAFQQRHAITPELVQELVAKVAAGVRHIHDHDMLVVDLNEMNLLVSQNLADAEVWFIDVDSYQTRGYPATAIMESIRDRHASRWCEGTDWFAFAVVTFQLHVGIHPYRGRHPDLPDIDARMQQQVSVFHPDVRYPKGPTRPFDVIPAPWLDWYEATFERGERCAPPTAGGRAVAWRGAPRAVRQLASTAFRIEVLLEVDDDILAVFTDGDRLAVLTPSGAVIDGRPRPCPPDAQIVWTATGTPVAARVDNGRLQLHDLDRDRPVPVDCHATSVITSGGRLFAHADERILEVDFVAPGARLLASVRPVGNAHPKTTRAFPGCFVQNLLGVHYATLLPATGICHQVALPELDGYQLVDAAYDRRALMLVGVDRAGRYDRFVVRFAADFGSHDVRVVRDVAYAGLEFVSLDKGVVVAIDEADRMELIPVAVGADASAVIEDDALQGARRLYRQGDRVLLARGPVLYRVRVG